MYLLGISPSGRKAKKILRISCSGCNFNMHTTPTEDNYFIINHLNYELINCCFSCLRHPFVRLSVSERTGCTMDLFISSMIFWELGSSKLYLTSPECEVRATVESIKVLEPSIYSANLGLQQPSTLPYLRGSSNSHITKWEKSLSVSSCEKDRVRSTQCQQMNTLLQWTSLALLTL